MLINLDSDSDFIKLSTKKGNRIPNEQRQEFHPETLREAEKLWKSKFPNIKTRSLSATYNCVGLVFGMRRTWIEPEHITMILKDDEYCRLDHTSKVERGDLVLYKKNNKYEHIGIVFNKDFDIPKAEFKITILSQWGAYGEYFHLVEDVPEQYGKSYEFWTERKLVV